MVPVGAPPLEAMATQEGGMEPEALARRRRSALWALATLGEGLKRFDTKLSDEARDAVEQELRSAADTGPQRAAAERALRHLERRRQGQPDALGLGPTLVKCADDPDPSIRYHAAFAMTFWVGGPVEEAEIEKALVRLAHDDGRGEDELEKRLADNPTAQQVRSLIKRRGFHVQPQAALALARRGSPQAPLRLLEEMLDEEKMGRAFVLLNRKTRAEQPDQGLVALTISDTLKALVQFHHKRPAADLSNFRSAVDGLAQHANPNIHTEARKARSELGWGG
jgi:hypothetical protein